MMMAVQSFAHLSDFAHSLFSCFGSDHTAAFEAKKKATRKTPYDYSQTCSLSKTGVLSWSFAMERHTNGPGGHSCHLDLKLNKAALSSQLSLLCSQPSLHVSWMIDSVLVPQRPGIHCQARDRCQSLQLENGDESAFFPKLLGKWLQFPFFIFASIGLAFSGEGLA